MAAKLVNNVKIAVQNTGTGALQLGSAIEGYRGVEALTNGEIYSYSIRQNAAFEYGRGTYLSSGRQFLRQPLGSSDGGTAINLASGAEIAFTPLAEDLEAVNLTASAQLAAQEAQADAAQVAIDRNRVETIANTGVGKVYPTWSALSVVTGAANDGAIVVDADTGTHTDPVVGGTVANAGVYRYSTSPAGWQWVSASTATQVAASATSAAANAAILSQFITPPSGYLSLLTVELADTVNGVAVTLPTNLTVRRFGRDSVSRFQCDFAAFDGASTYTPAFYAENGGGGYGNYQFVTGQTGPKSYDALCADASLGVPVGTVIGKIYVSDISGPFGSELNTDIAWSVGGMYPTKLQSTTVDLQRINEGAKKAIAAQSAMFNPTATDGYATLLFGDIVGIGDPNDDYFLNYTIDNYGGTTLYDFNIYLCSTKLGGAVVARKEYRTTNDPTIEFSSRPTIQLTLVTDGTPTSGDVGTSCFITMNWAALDFSRRVHTSYTNASATGIKRGKLKGSEDRRIVFLAKRCPYADYVTVKPSGGDFATVTAAMHAIENSTDFVGGTITRSSYPTSDRCGEERPVLVEVTGTLTEQPGEFFVSTPNGDIWQSQLRLPHGVILRTRPDTIIRRTNTGHGTPAVEMSFTSRLEGSGTIETLDFGYAVHVDNFNKITRGYRRLTTYIGELLIRSGGTNLTSLIGVGISDDQYLMLDGTTLQLNGSGRTTDVFILAHTTPGCVLPATIHLRNVNSNQPAIGGSSLLLSLLKSDVQTARHNVIVENSECTKIDAGTNAGGNIGFIKRGSLAGITYPSGLNP